MNTSNADASSDCTCPAADMASHDKIAGRPCLLTGSMLPSQSYSLALFWWPAPWAPARERPGPPRTAARGPPPRRPAPRACPPRGSPGWAHANLHAPSREGRQAKCQSFMQGGRQTFRCEMSPAWPRAESLGSERLRERVQQAFDPGGNCKDTRVNPRVETPWHTIKQGAINRVPMRHDSGGAPSVTPSKLDVLVVPALLPAALRLGKLNGACLPPSSFS